MKAMRKILSGKIHKARVTHADLNYEGSISLAPELIEAAGFLPYEAVQIWDVTNGARIETYVIEGQVGSSDISINGAAAHLIHPGDIIIIAAFEYLPFDQARRIEPKVVFVDSENRVRELRTEVPGPQLVQV